VPHVEAGRAFVRWLRKFGDVKKPGAHTALNYPLSRCAGALQGGGHEFNFPTAKVKSNQVSVTRQRPP